MKAIHLVELAQKFAARDENIEDGVVNWDSVGADLYQDHADSFAPYGENYSPLDPVIIELTLFAAALIVEPNRKWSPSFVAAVRCEMKHCGPCGRPAIKVDK